MKHFVAFTLDGQRYAVPLAAVERVVRVVEVTPLPKAPEIVLGIVNVQGRVIPIVKTRKRFGLPERDIELSDQLIIAATGRRTVALLVDAVSDVLERPDREVIEANEIVPGMAYVAGALKLGDGMVLIHDLEAFLSLEEEKALDDGLAQA